EDLRTLLIRSCRRVHAAPFMPPWAVYPRNRRTVGNVAPSWSSHRIEPRIGSRGGIRLVPLPPPNWALGISGVRSARRDDDGHDGGRYDGRTARNGAHKAMRLTGLLTAALDDAALATVADLAKNGGPAAAQVDITAPAALRPFIVAAIA